MYPSITQGFNSLNNNKLTQGGYNPGGSQVSSVPTGSLNKQNYQNYYNNNQYVNSTMTNNYANNYSSNLIYFNLDYYQQQQKNLNYKTVNNTTIPYHSNLPQCNQNFNNLKQTLSNDPNKKDEVKKPTYSIKDMPEMTVGSFLSNKNMQQMYFSYVKNPGKEPEAGVTIPMEVTQVIEKAPINTKINQVTTSNINQINSMTQVNQVNQLNQVNQMNKVNIKNPSNPHTQNTRPHMNTVSNVNHMNNMNTVNAIKASQQLNQNYQNQKEENTPKGFYTPSPGEVKNIQPSQSNQPLLNTNINPNQNNNLNQPQQGLGFSKQKTINTMTTMNTIQMPSYPSVTNFNIQNYNFNNYNTNMPPNVNQQFTNVNNLNSTTSTSNTNNVNSPEFDSAKFASSNLNLTTASGKSINIQKTSTIPKNNALVKTAGQKLRVNLNPDTGNTDTSLFNQDFIPLKSNSISSDSPDTLKSYIVRSFEKCSNDNDRKKCEQALQRIISNAKKKGQLTTRNWNKFPLPKLPGELEDNVNCSKIIY